MRFLLLVTLGLAAGAAMAAETSQLVTTQETQQAKIVHMRGLDTIASRAVDIDVNVGETVKFGRLEIKAEACRVPREDPEADAYAFLQICDDREQKPRFSGWMFASSPALSALDHPRYDVWVVSCSNS